MLDIHAKLRSQLRAGRELMGMTQSELAEALSLGLQKISKAENGNTKTEGPLREIKQGMERLGVLFTPNGVEFAHSHIETLEGEQCYLRLLEDVYHTLAPQQDKELLIMFASDAVSPPEINDYYRFMRKQGLTMRQIIAENDDYIMGPLEEYRSIPSKYFTNIVTLVYRNEVAQVSGDERRITIHRNDRALADRERKTFAYFWDTGTEPSSSSAMEKLD